MDEESERQKLLSFGLTEDVIEIVIAKKRTLEKQKSCVIIADPIPIPEPIPEQIHIDIIPEPEIPVVEIKEEEHKVVEIKQETKIYTGMPLWKRRLSQRNQRNNK
jgi:hypothetical protein